MRKSALCLDLWKQIFISTTIPLVKGFESNMAECIGQGGEYGPVNDSTSDYAEARVERHLE